MLGVIFSVVVTSLFWVSAIHAQSAPGTPSLGEGSCPSLENFYAQIDRFSSLEQREGAWVELAEQLMGLMPACLESSEYFALLGAAHLNGLGNSRAIEFLERALLLEPTNGAARIDYAQALYNAGQLFPALEISEQLLVQSELPEAIRGRLEERIQIWRQDTRQQAWLLDVSGGYDNNLNGAPSASEITLTLSGESIALPLSSEYQSTSGGYSNLRLASLTSWLAPEQQQSFTAEVKGRVSGDSRSDLLQLDSRYSFLKPSRGSSWQVDTGLTHLLFGGSALYSAADLRGRYAFNLYGDCDTSLNFVGQRQYFQQQRNLNALEGRIGAGLVCSLKPGGSAQGASLGVDFGVIQNYATESLRPGGDRRGWQASTIWRSAGFLAQLSRTILNDDRTYSSILSGGANRWVRRDQLILQYRRPFRWGPVPSAFNINFLHQEQESNIELFVTDDTILELGFSFAF